MSVRCKYCKTVGWKCSRNFRNNLENSNIAFSHFISIFCFLPWDKVFLKSNKLWECFARLKSCVREKEDEWGVVSCDTDTEETGASGKEWSQSAVPWKWDTETTVSNGLSLLLQWLDCLAPLHNVHNIISLRKFGLTGSGSNEILTFNIIPATKKKRSCGKRR